MASWVNHSGIVTNSGRATFGGLFFRLAKRKIHFSDTYIAMNDESMFSWVYRATFEKQDREFVVDQ